MVQQKSVIVSILFLILLCALSGTVQAKELWSGTVRQGNTADTPIGEFKVYHYVRDNAEMISLSSNNVAMTLDEGECEYDDDYKFCFIDSERKEDFDIGEFVYDVQLRIDELVPSVTRTVSDEALFIGETGTVTVSISNPADQRVTVNYVEIFDGATATGRKVETFQNTAKKELVVRESERFTYDFEFQGPDEAVLEGYYTYQYRGEEKRVDLGTLKVTEKRAIGIDVNIDDVILQQPFDVVIELDNNGLSESITVKELRIDLPQGMLVSDRGDFERVNGDLVWQGNVGSEEVELTITARVTTPNVDVLPVTAVVVADGRESTITVEEELDIDYKQGSIRLYVPSTIRAIENVQVKAELTNNNDVMVFEDVECVVDGPLYNGTHSVGKLLSDRTVTFVDQRVSIPEEMNNQTITHTMNCKYSVFGFNDGASEVKESSVEIDPQIYEDARQAAIEAENALASVNETNVTANMTNSSTVHEQEEEGFFASIWSWVTGLFSSEDASSDTVEGTQLSSKTKDNQSDTDNNTSSDV